MEKGAKTKQIIERFLTGNPKGAFLQKEDVATYVWDSLHASLAESKHPNIWEVEASSDDVYFWGSTGSIARACAYAVWDVLKDEKLDSEVAEYCVLCVENPKVRRGVLRIQANELDRQDYLHWVAVAKYQDNAAVTFEDIKECDDSYRDDTEHVDLNSQNVDYGPNNDLMFRAEYYIYCSEDGSETDLTGDLYVGRRGDNNIVIENKKVSRSHGEFMRDYSAPSGWAYLDLGSTYGSKLNGRVLLDKALLAEGDIIDIAGVCALEFRRR